MRHPASRIARSLDGVQWWLIGCLRARRRRGPWVDQKFRSRRPGEETGNGQVCIPAASVGHRACDCSFHAASGERLSTLRFRSMTTGLSSRRNPPMGQSQRSSRPSFQTVGLRLYKGDSPSCRPIRWRINGYPATLWIWSADEWEHLQNRPSDAQFHPLGVWCALRLD